MRRIWGASFLFNCKSGRVGEGGTYEAVEVHGEADGGEQVDGDDAREEEAMDGEGAFVAQARVCRVDAGERLGECQPRVHVRLTLVARADQHKHLQPRPHHRHPSPRDSV
jgi:hypothetical protein